MRKILLIFVLAISVSAFAQDDKPKGKFNGVLFGDYFYKVEGDSSGTSNQFSPNAKGVQGFTIRRTRLHYEHTFNKDFIANIGIESNDLAKLDSKMSFILYDANFEWKNVVPNSSIYFGLMPTPTFVWGISETMWGFRGVEKTISDKNGIGSAVDIGVALKGYFDKESKYGYMVQIGNGKSLKPEVSKYPKFYGSLFVKFFGNFIAEAYFDYQSGENEQYKYTLKSVVGYKDKHNSLTFEPLFQNRNNAIRLESPQNPVGFSLNGKVNLSRKTDLEQTEIINAYARYDYFNPNSAIGYTGFSEHFITAGIDFLPFKNFHIIPNLWMMMYKDKSAANITKPNDVVGRVTFWFIY